MKVSRFYSAALLTLALSVAGAGVSQAQTASASPAKPRRIQVLTQELGLNPAQVASVGALLDARSDALKQIRLDDSKDADAKKKATAAVMKDYGAKIRAELNTEQKAAYAELIKREAAGN